MIRNVTRPSGSLTFYRELRAYPASLIDRADVQKGDKILLPSSALQELYPILSSKNKSPMVFCIKNGSRMTYCGVLEFVAEQGNCYLPEWMYRMLSFKDYGDPATVALTQIKRRSQRDMYTVKIKPHKTAFIEINNHNPRPVLENLLRNFTCLHEGDTITLDVFGKKFEIDILQITPKNQYNAFCIVDSDVQVDFAPPHDYEEPQPVQQPVPEPNPTRKQSWFSGTGIRIDDKKVKDNNNPSRKGSVANVAPEKEEYDPRKHRIHRGVRKISMEFTGEATKLKNY